VRGLPARAWRWATNVVGTRLGSVLIVVAAFGVFAVQALGWPVAEGRDLEAYLTVYVDFWDDDPVFPWAMVTRTPVAPLVVGGILDVGSPIVVELVAAALFAGTILLYARTALLFGSAPAVLVAVALLLYPGYGVIFHELASEIVFAVGFAIWTAVVVRAAIRPSVALFGLAGLATALLALTRPANQVFLIAALLPLLLPGSWRARLLRTAAYAGVAVVLLAAWSTVNLVRFDDFTVARGAGSSLPLFRAFVVDRIVHPDNGDASRQVGAAVERELLDQEPYRAYGIDLETFFAEGSPRMHEDLISLSDRIWGWDSDYQKLGEAAWEGVRAHPGTYARGVLGDFWEELSQPLFAGREAQAATPDTPDETAAAPAPPAAGGAELPTPTEGEPIPSEHQSAQLSTPDQSIREVWTSPTEHHVVFDDPSKTLHQAANDRRMAELYAAFPDRWWSPWLGLQMDRSSKLYPPPWLWLLVGALAVAWRRPERWWATVTPVAASLAMLLGTVMAVWAEPAYAVPVAPAFVLFAAVGLLGERRVASDGATSTSSIATRIPFRAKR
jgi:hypothetical protein